MAEEPIRSRQNQWIKRVRKALERHDQEIVLEGRKTISDALASGWSPLVILQDQEQSVSHDDAQTVESSLFRELTSTRTSQGVIALFSRPDESIENLLGGEPLRIVALDSVQDPGNVGTIIRSAAAFGLTGVICLPGTADPWAPKSIRSSAGAVMTIPIVRTSIEHLLDLAREHQLNVFTADGRATSTTISPSGNFVIVFGSEGQGVSSELAAISRGVRIPMSSRVESLNVAAAAAIILSRLYEADRRVKVQSEK